MSCNIGDWSSGMIGVSKTFGGSSILSSPAPERVRNALFTSFSGFFVFNEKSKGIKKGIKKVSN